VCQPPYYSNSPGTLSASAGTATSGTVAGEAADAAGGGRSASNGAKGSGAAPSSGGGGVHEDGGCQMGTSPADALSGMWLAFAGLAGWAARRRTRRA
jgi:MYXO-CTERM domain-containing protein